MKYKVKAIISFNDLEENTHRKIGDVFEVSQRRKDYLLEHKAVEIVEENNDNGFIIADTKVEGESIIPLDEKATEKVIEEIEKHIEVKPIPNAKPEDVEIVPIPNATEEATISYLDDKPIKSKNKKSSKK